MTGLVSTNCGILPSWMGEHGVCLENMDNMEKIQNIEQMQEKVSFETED